MGGFTAKITGLKELDAKLGELATGTAARVVREGLKAGGAVLQTAIRERTPDRVPLPSGTALPPGALAADIEVRLGRDAEGQFATIGPGRYTRCVARWLEYGHRLVRGGYSKVVKAGRNAGTRRGPGTEVGDVPAHPFIRPAYEVAREQAAAVTVETIAKGIEKAAKK